LLNDTRYRNQIFYVPTFINSLGAEYSFFYFVPGAKYVYIQAFAA